MANIAKLPDGKWLALHKPDGWTRSYGPQGLAVRVVAANGGAVAELSRSHDWSRLATVDINGKCFVSFARLDPLTVPYVNRFLAGTDKVVIKDWRTKEYRTKVRSGGPKVVTPTPTPQPEAAAFAKPITVVIEDDEEAAVEVAPRGAVITISAESRSTLSAIPGVEFLNKVALKGAGRGYTNVGGIVVPTTDLHTLQDAWELRQLGKPGAVLLTGPAGTAKTMLVRSFAASLGVPYLKVDAGSVRTADDWSGTLRQDPATKTWAHIWSPFARVLRANEPAIIHVDELTRTESPAALNAFMGLLDETGRMLVPDANDVLRLPKGVLVVATANIGPEFVGTLPLDGAVRQRFPYGVRMAPPPEATEAKLLVDRTGVTLDIAQRLVRMAVEQRKHRDDAQLYPSGAIISTRVLLSIAERIGSRNADPRSAVVSTLHGQFDPGDDAALSVVIDTQFPKTVRLGNSVPAEPTEASIVTERHYFVFPAGGGNDCGWTFADGTPCLRTVNDTVHLT
jgi:MoxR-like ATPase